jgi:hypothetical protein
MSKREYNKLVNQQAAKYQNELANIMRICQSSIAQPSL